MKGSLLCAAALLTNPAVWASSLQEPPLPNELMPRPELWTGVPLPPWALLDAALLTPGGLIGVPAPPENDSGPVWISGTGLPGFIWLWPAAAGSTIPGTSEYFPWPVPVLPPLPGAPADLARLPVVEQLAPDSSAPEPAVTGMLLLGLTALLFHARRMRRDRS